MDAPTTPDEPAQGSHPLIPSDTGSGGGGVLQRSLEMGEALGGFLHPLLSSRLVAGGSN